MLNFLFQNKESPWTKWMFVEVSNWAGGPDHLVFTRKNRDTGLWQFKTVAPQGATYGGRAVGDFITQYEKEE